MLFLFSVLKMLMQSSLPCKQKFMTILLTLPLAGALAGQSLEPKNTKLFSQFPLGKTSANLRPVWFCFHVDWQQLLTGIQRHKRYLWFKAPSYIGRMTVLRDQGQAGQRLALSDSGPSTASGSSVSLCASHHVDHPPCPH